MAASTAFTASEEVLKEEEAAEASRMKTWR